MGIQQFHRRYLFPVLLFVYYNFPLWLSNCLHDISTLTSFSLPENAGNTNKTKTIVWQGVGKRKSFYNFLRRYWKENILCNFSQTHPYSKLDIQLGSCQNFLQESTWGTGNILTAYYGLRVSALHQHLDWQISCDDAFEAQSINILSWVMGSFQWNDGMANLTGDPVLQCSTFNHAPLGIIAEQIQLDLRRMALSLVTPPPEHPAHDWAQRQKLHEFQSFQIPFRTDPIYPNARLDDTTIHFRGGDLFSSKNPDYGFLRFNAYKKIIQQSKATPRSIGIITQTLGSNSSCCNDSNTSIRSVDLKQAKPHKTLVKALAQYLQEEFPTATIHIHSEDDMPLSYARMILSNQTIGAFSSFAVFPAMATFGTGYLRHPEGNGPYRWITNSDVPSNVKLFEESDFLLPSVVKYVWKTLGLSVLLKWLRGEITTEELKRFVVAYEQGATNKTIQWKE
jgi:hypothetical protein